MRGIIQGFIHLVSSSVQRAFYVTDGQDHHLIQPAGSHYTILRVLVPECFEPDPHASTLAQRQVLRHDIVDMARDRSSAQQSISSMLTKISDPDPDIRFMQLSDLTNVLKANTTEYIRQDTHTAARLIEALLKALTDQHGEVQNQALKW